MSSEYSPEQLEALCTSLYAAKDGASLVRVFQTYGEPLLSNGQWPSQNILLAYVYALLHAGNFTRLYEIVGRHNFEEKHFKELTDIYYEARYKEFQNESKKGKMLGPVDKYRLRRKYPPPRSIWDGQETIYSFKENSRKYLVEFYKTERYPTMEMKKEISRNTDLNIVQISNWFKNRRQRDKPANKSESEFNIRPTHHHHNNNNNINGTIHQSAYSTNINHMPSMLIHYGHFKNEC